MSETVLSEREYEFLRSVCLKTPLRHASREEDRARQRVRKMGLVEVLMSPRRWSPTARGLAWFTALSKAGTD